MITAALVLLVALTAAVYLAPGPTLATSAALAAARWPEVAVLAVKVGVVAVVLVAAALIWRELRATGPGLIWHRA
ncbi:hypothetical protein [Actinomadura kijaniata]|uniref:hypothetical protein n=1 Tax=Actinomadura kijaniata TaxID=46161 RepID=UPI00082A37B1|nr:hypothetical protein [Actinomadura kijaniata]